MAKVVAVANQKGGVAKTTTVHSLGVGPGRAGPRVLLVDLDPQACLTYSLGFDPDCPGRLAARRVRPASQGRPTSPPGASGSTG